MIWEFEELQLHDSLICNEMCYVVWCVDESLVRTKELKTQSSHVKNINNFT